MNIRPVPWCALFVIGVWLSHGRAWGAGEAVTQKVDVLGAVRAGEVTYFANPAATPQTEAQSHWAFNDEGQLKSDGVGQGYLATKKSYHNYELVVEYRLSASTAGKHGKKAHHCGVILHGHGADGAVSGAWLPGIEAQIMEGATGDLIALGDAEFAAASQPEGEIALRWLAAGQKQKVSGSGKIQTLYWEKRDPYWQDSFAFQGKQDIQSRVNEWTRLRVIAKGDTLQVFVNGVLVNEASDAHASEGKIGLLSDGSELLVKRFELYPLGGFKEGWNPAFAAGGTEISVRESREEAWSPEKERQGIVIDGPYDVQLVASEPLVKDPVEITWDAKGRAFVADMMDYPLGPGPGKPPLSRIQMLIDDHHDGHYNRAVTYADHLDHVQGLLPYKDGLIATTRTQILFIRDSKGDGAADEIKPLAEGFNPNYSQLQVASPRWGLDGYVYFNNGLDTKEIYPPGEPDKKHNFARTNLRWDPSTGKFEPASGFGQYGGCFDDYGRHYYSSNRNPVMMTVMPYEAVARNPHAGILQGWEDIAPTGADTRVYPLMITHTTADAHAGTHTAACGLGVYRGDLMPELRGEIFVCEPTAQCVVRYHPTWNGASLKASRVGDHKDFFRCWDEWCRPVNVTTGPDGALYVCDIYRRYIDHARFFPEEFVKTHNMRAGDEEGRIWRIVPKGKQARPIEPAPTSVEGLVQWLAHPNAWQRETAQRLLAESPREKLDEVMADLHTKDQQLEQQTISKVTVEPGASMADQRKLYQIHRANLLYALDKRDGFAPHPSAAKKNRGHILPLQEKSFDDTSAQLSRVGITDSPDWQADLGRGAVLAMTGSDHKAPYLVSKAIQYSRQVLKPSSEKGRSEPEQVKLNDVWIHRAILSASANQAGAVLSGFLAPSEAMRDTYSPERADFIRALASCSAADANTDDFATMLGLFKQESGKMVWWKAAMLQGMAEGLPKSENKLGFSTMAQFLAHPPAAYHDAAAEINALQTHVEGLMIDASAPLADRLGVIPLLAQRPWEKAEPLVRNLLADNQPEEIRTATRAILRKFPTDKTAPVLYEILPKLQPDARREIVALLSGNIKTLEEFLHRIESGAVDRSYVSAETRWGYQHSGNKAVRELADKVFPRPSEDRAALVNQYLVIAERKGDAAKGHAIFASICIACHKFKGEGVEVGPDITDVRVKPPEALLSDILDPNRMVEARFMAYQIDTRDNRTLVGVVGAETADAVTLKLPGGQAESVPRANIAKMKCLDQSLMPVGLEGAINKDQMADLLAFLKGT